MDGMIEYVQYVLDTSLSPDHSQDDVGPGAMLVGWETESEPMVVAVIAATMDTQGRPGFGGRRRGRRDRHRLPGRDRLVQRWSG
jgi:hypothetical protein